MKRFHKIHFLIFETLKVFQFILLSLQHTAWSLWNVSKIKLIFHLMSILSRHWWLYFNLISKMGHSFKKLFWDLVYSVSIISWGKCFTLFLTDLSIWKSKKRQYNYFLIKNITCQTYRYLIEILSKFILNINNSLNEVNLFKLS